MGKLTGKVAYVTGSGRGIGRALAQFITLPWMRTGESFSRASMIHEAYSHERFQVISFSPLTIAFLPSIAPQA